jgi:hypothetical protein
MSGESIVGILAALSGIIGSLFAGFIALRREKRDAVAADAAELVAYRLAWLWAVRLITRLRTIIASADGVSEPEGIDAEMRQHMDQIEGRNPEGSAQK